MDKKNVFIGVLCILLLVSVGYILLTAFEQEKAKNLSAGYQEGYSYGVKETVYTLLQQTDGCKPASVNFGNYTREVVDTACLKNSS